MDEIIPINNITPNSPDLQSRQLDHKIKYEDTEQKNKLSMCCCNEKTDVRLLIFLSTFTVTFTLLIFSCYQLAHVNDCQSENLYVGLITLVVGVWVKSPLSN